MYPYESKEHIQLLESELKKLIRNYEHEYPDAANELRNKDYIIAHSNMPEELLEAISIKEELRKIKLTNLTLKKI